MMFSHQPLVNIRLDDPGGKRCLNGQIDRDLAIADTIVLEK